MNQQAFGNMGNWERETFYDAGENSIFRFNLPSIYGSTMIWRVPRVACLCSVLTVSLCLFSKVEAATVGAGQSERWVIELMPFQGRASAEAFVDRLNIKVFQAEITGSRTSGFLTRTGMFSSFEAATAYRERLRADTNLKEHHMAIVGPIRYDDIMAWGIDLYRYSKPGAADALIERLEKSGFDGRIVQVDVNGSPYYQCRISGLADQVEVEAYLMRLRQMGIDSRNLKIISPASDLQVAEVSGDAAPNEPVAVAVIPPQQTQSISEKGDELADSPLSIENENRIDHGFDPLSRWPINGSNTLRSDAYGSKGNVNATPYRYSKAHTYDELSLNFDRSFSAYNRVSGQISGLAYNDSLYRSPYPGSVLERLNLRQENGAFFIPYRAEAGDVFAFQSYRTIQRSLKGGKLEFQPQWGGDNWKNSIELFSGSATPTWETFQYQDDFSSGASWLVQQSLLGTLSANVVTNHKQANGFAQPGLRQYVSSLAWEKRAAVLGQKLLIEAEAGRFMGDHAVVAAGVSNTRRQGNGLFGQISGSFNVLPQLSYRFRGEAYEQDYLPNGASIQSDRTSQEGYLTWRTSTGLSLATRLQHYHSGWQTTNPTDTISYGGNISGLIPLIAVTGSIDGFVSDVEDRNLTVNTIAKSVNVNLSRAITPNLSARGGFSYTNNRDKNNAASLSITKQYNAGVDYRFQGGGISGSVSPGFTARRMYQQNIRRWDFNPTLNTSLIYGSNQLSLALSKLDQSSMVASGGVDTMTAGLNYRYTQPLFTIGLDANWYDRQPDNTGTIWTNAWRIGAYLTINFDKPVRQLAMAEPQTVSDAAPERPAIERLLFDIARIKPGMQRDQAEALVAAAGIGKATEQAGVLIWYARIFRDIIENQRLALELSGDRIARSALIIDPMSTTDVAGIRNLFELMRRELLMIYGSPDSFFDQGDFVPGLGAELAAGRFIRVMEWNRDGGVLRFGIPRRLDGVVRMELQFAPGFASLKDTLWSMEQVQ